MNVLNGVALLQDRRPTREAARVAYLLQVVSLKAQPSVGLLKLEAQASHNLRPLVFHSFSSQLLFFLLVYLCLRFSCSVVSKPTLETPWTSLPGSPVYGIYLCSAWFVVFLERFWGFLSRLRDLFPLYPILLYFLALF